MSSVIGTEGEKTRLSEAYTDSFSVHVTLTAQLVPSVTTRYLTRKSTLFTANKLWTSTAELSHNPPKRRHETRSLLLQSGNFKQLLFCTAHVQPHKSAYSTHVHHHHTPGKDLNQLIQQTGSLFCKRGLQVTHQDWIWTIRASVATCT